MLPLYVRQCIVSDIFCSGNLGRVGDGNNEYYINVRWELKGEFWEFSSLAAEVADLEETLQTHIREILGLNLG